jgi:hypothetical protein
MKPPFLEGRCLDGRAGFSKAGWLGIALCTISAASSATITTAAPRDTRPAKLLAFFQAYGCREPLHIADYLRAADTYAIDYRLLPALSVRESTCGQHERKNNRWGWDSARMGFASVAAGIEYIARELAWGRYYRGKTLEQKLRTYNPNPRYAREVEKLMRQIASD